jgi:hypothetical protein
MHSKLLGLRTYTLMFLTYLTYLTPISGAGSKSQTSSISIRSYLLEMLAVKFLRCR